MSKKYLVSLDGVDYVWGGSNVQKDEKGNLVFVYLDEGARLHSIPAARCDDVKQFDVISSFDLDFLNPETNKMESDGMGKHSILYKATLDSETVIIQENWSDFSGVLSTGKVINIMDLYSLADTHPDSQRWVMYSN